MHVLALVIARRCSKKIPMKNLRKLVGKTLVEHSILSAKNSKLINRIIISTDSQEIARIAKHAGAEVPFIRPKKYSRDSSSQLEVIKHALSFLKKNESYIPDIVTILHPTNPLRTPKLLDRSIRVLKKTNADLVLGVHIVSTHPYRSFWYRKGYLKKFISNFDKYYQRQLFPALYFPTGDIYTFSYESYKNSGKIFGKKIKPLFLKENEVSVNIDKTFDLFIAEMTMKYWNKYKQKFNK